jgi:hypothetical protein
MKRVKRTEITIETEDVLILRGKVSATSPAASRRGCARCGAQAEMLTPESAARMYSADARAVFLLIVVGIVHFEETPEGSMLVCLPSLAAASATATDRAADDLDREGVRRRAESGF